MKKSAGLAALLAALLLPLLASTSDPAAVEMRQLEAAAPGLDARELAERVEAVFRGDTTIMEATMTVVSPRLPAPRTVTFRSWDDRSGKRSFIRILKPPRDAGMSFLKLHPNLWNYIPRVERTLRIPPSMMLQPWMGSDFTNDDLVRESSVLDDYDHRLLGVHPGDGEGAGRAYVVEYRPHEEAPVVWGRIVVWIAADTLAPLRQDYYDEDGTRLREMRFDDFRDVQGRLFPHRWSMLPLDKEGYQTRIEIAEIRFDPEIAERVFTKRNLAQRD